MFFAKRPRARSEKRKSKNKIAYLSSKPENAQPKELNKGVSLHSVTGLRTKNTNLCDINTERQSYFFLADHNSEIH